MGRWQEWGAWANAQIESGIRWNAVESDYVSGWGGYGAGFGLIQFTSQAIQVLNYIASNGGDINLIPPGNLKTAIQTNNGAGYNGVSSGATNSAGPYTPAETEGLHKFLDTEGAKKAQSVKIREFYNNNTAGSMEMLQKTFPTNDMAKCIGMRIATNYGNALTYCSGNNDNTPLSELIAQANTFSQYLKIDEFVALLQNTAGDFQGDPPVNVWNYGGGGTPSPKPPKPSNPGGNNVKPKPKPKPKPTSLQLKPGRLVKDGTRAYKFIGQTAPRLQVIQNQLKLSFDVAPSKPGSSGGNSSTDNQNTGKNPKPKPDPTPPPTTGGSLKAQLDAFYGQYKGQYIQNGQCVGLTSAWMTHLTGGVYGLTPWNSQDYNPPGSPTSANKHFDYQTNIPGTPPRGWESAAQIGRATPPPGWVAIVPQSASDCKAGDIFYVSEAYIAGSGHTGIVFQDGSGNTVPTIEQNFSGCPVQYFAGGAYNSWGLYPWFKIWRKQ